MKSLLILVVLVSTLFGAVSCTKKKNLEHGLKFENTMRLNIDQEPPTLDWSKASDTTSSLIIDNIMEGLTDYNLEDPDLSLQPMLATKWVSSKKAQTWTFTLRKGVKWTDGVEFEAQHVVDAWKRLLAPATASKYAYFLFALKNAQKFNDGTIKNFSEVGVKAKGKYTLVVKLEQPMSYFPSLLTHTSTYPIRLDVIAKHGENKWTDPANIVTLGAFTLKIWEHDKSIVLTRNKTYFGEPAKIENILCYMINEQSTAINLFDAGKLDAQRQLPSSELRILKKRKEFSQVGILGIFYFGMNLKKAPMDNVKVRKAISMAIDRSEVTNLLAGGQTPITGFIPKGMFGFEKVGVDFDPKRAAQLLDEAGFKDRKKVPVLSLGYNTNDNHKRVAENVQAQLKRNLGITVELKNEEWKVYLRTLQFDAPHIYRMGWLADFPDPDNFLNLLTSYSSNNHTGWKNKNYDKLIENAVSNTVREERRLMYSKAQKILLEQDVPVIPVYSMVQQYLINSRIKGFPVNSMAKFKFNKVEVIGR